MRGQTIASDQNAVVFAEPRSRASIRDRGFVAQSQAGKDCFWISFCKAIEGECYSVGASQMLEAAPPLAHTAAELLKPAQRLRVRSSNALRRSPRPAEQPWC